MIKTDRMLRTFIAALLKYAENSKVFNPTFTSQQIPEIFGGWTEAEFNVVHHGAGNRCCTCIGPNRYQINVDHCHASQSKFADSDRGKWRLVAAVVAIIIALIGTLFTILNYTGHSQ